MALRYPALTDALEKGAPKVKSDAVQTGSVLPPVEVEGVSVRFVATGETTRSGIAVLEVLGGRGGEA